MDILRYFTVADPAELFKLNTTVRMKVVRNMQKSFPSYIHANSCDRALIASITRAEIFIIDQGHKTLVNSYEVLPPLKIAISLPANPVLDCSLSGQAR